MSDWSKGVYDTAFRSNIYTANGVLTRVFFSRHLEQPFDGLPRYTIMTRQG